MIFALLVVFTCGGLSRASDGVELLGVRRIWDAAPHNAFTSLVRYRDRWVCAFREAPAHVGPSVNGKMRVICSDDTEHWESAALLEDSRGDVRDAKLSITPDGRLMLLTVTHVRGNPARHQSVAWFTSDLKTWEGPVDVGEPNVWLWGIRWHKGVGYSIGYSTGAEHFVRPYKTTDGRHFERLADRLKVPVKFPNENAIVFDRDDVAHVLLRADPDHACIGRAAPPYSDWTFEQANARVGGPAMMLTPSGRLLGGGRLHEPKVHTALFWVDPEKASITECLALPSGGDTSYPGLVYFDGVLYVSYYSSHEKHTAIYLAKCRLPAERAEMQAQEPDKVLLGALQERGELASIHAAEDLIELGRHVDAVRAAFEPQADETRPAYRIGVWRVLARCARDESGRARFVEKIRSALLDAAAADHAHAMEALAKLNAPVTEAERPLVVATASGPASDGPFAAWRLAAGGDEKSVQRLVTQLSSADPVIRARAAYSLHRLEVHTAEVRQAFQAALDREPASSPARPLIVVALGGRPVRSLLADPAPAARYHAAMYLSGHGSRDDLEAIGRLLRDADPDVRVAAAYATLCIEDREPGATTQIDKK
jgi:hypothetical protein